jgi:hypothetical protein
VMIVSGMIVSGMIVSGIIFLGISPREVTLRWCVG